MSYLILSLTILGMAMFVGAIERKFRHYAALPAETEYVGQIHDVHGGAAWEARGAV